METFTDVDANNGYLVIEGEGIQLGTNISTKMGHVVFPVPAKDILIVNFSEGALNSKVTIFDLNGRLVKEAIINDTTSIHIDISGLSAGNYILKITNASNITSQKIIIK